MKNQISRRNFLKKIGLIGGGLVLANQLPKKAHATGETPYFYDKFDEQLWEDNFAKQSIDGRYGRFGAGVNTFTDSGHLCFQGHGGVRVANYNGIREQDSGGNVGPSSIEDTYYDAQQGDLDLTAKFTVAGEYTPNNDNKYLDFGFDSGLNIWLGFRITPGQPPTITFRDTADKSYQETPVELTARESYILRVITSGNQVLASLKRDNEKFEDILAIKQLSDIYGRISFDLDGGSQDTPFNWAIDRLMIKGPGVNPVGSDQLSIADLTQNGEVNHEDVILMIDRISKGEATKGDLVDFILEYEKEAPHDKESVTVLKGFLQSAVNSWDAYR